MSIHSLNVRSQEWFDTKVNLQTANPVPLQGEMVFEKDGDFYRLKLGDGVRAYNSLPYVGCYVVESMTSPTISDYKHPIGTLWIRTNGSTSPNRCYYLESVVDSIATWRKIITDLDLSDFAAINHVHGNITRDGKIGSVAGNVIVTGTGGVLIGESQKSAFNTNFGNASQLRQNGTASAGTASEAARIDHVHPSDSSKISTSMMGVPNGVATLGEGGKIPVSQIPGSVNEFQEVQAFVATLPTSGLTIDHVYYNTSDKKLYTAKSSTQFHPGVSPIGDTMYIDKSTSFQYIWTGTDMLNIAQPLQFATDSDCNGLTENTKVISVLGVTKVILQWLKTKAISLLGTFSPLNSAITGNDTLLTALRKAQGQINNKEGLLYNSDIIETFENEDYAVIIVDGVVTRRINKDKLIAALNILTYDDDSISVNTSGKLTIKEGGVQNYHLAGGITHNKLDSVAVRSLILDGDTLVLKGGPQ